MLLLLLLLLLLLALEPTQNDVRHLVAQRERVRGWIKLELPCRRH